MTAPLDPMTPLREQAEQQHEVFRAYVEAGFTEAQAIYLVGQMLRGAMAQPGSDA